LLSLCASAYKDAVQFNYGSRGEEKFDTTESGMNGTQYSVLLLLMCSWQTSQMGQTAPELCPGLKLGMF